MEDDETARVDGDSAEVSSDEQNEKQAEVTRLDHEMTVEQLENARTVERIIQTLECQQGVSEEEGESAEGESMEEGEEEEEEEEEEPPRKRQRGDLQVSHVGIAASASSSLPKITTAPKTVLRVQAVRVKEVKVTPIAKFCDDCSRVLPQLQSAFRDAVNKWESKKDVVELREMAKGGGVAYEKYEKIMVGKPLSLHSLQDFAAFDGVRHMSI